jgi:hypothetical protein
LIIEENLLDVDDNPTQTNIPPSQSPLSIVLAFGTSTVASNASTQLLVQMNLFTQVKQICQTFLAKWWQGRNID